MRLVLLATCSGGDCPSIWDDQDGSDVLIQGYPVTPDEGGIPVPPPGEQLVRIPRSMLVEAASRLTSTA